MTTKHQAITTEMLKDFESRREAYETQLSNMRNQNEHDKQAITGKMRKDFESRREAYETQLSNMRSQNEHDTQQMMTEHQATRAKMYKDFEMQLWSMERKHTQEMDRKTGEMCKMKNRHEAEKKEMKELHDAEKAALEIKWKQENKCLRNDVEALKGALVKRDRFKGMSDHEIAVLFQNLASDIDCIARVQWDNRQESSWPFPDRMLSNSENKRRTKQHIIQNTMWVILYERIFCTPFRMLGNRGKLLELDWIAKYGQGEHLVNFARPND